MFTLIVSGKPFAAFEVEQWACWAVREAKE